jgi:glycosyltransferase involved in cell wall biosynthesis
MKKTKSYPEVSIILPTYNHVNFLPRSIDSILQQTYHNFELIIINDGSVDGTKEYLETLTDLRVKVIHQDNKRLPAALNAGFGIARGELLTWTSADNYCLPHFLATLTKSLDDNPSAGFVLSAFALINEKGIPYAKHDGNHDFSLARLLACNPGNASFMYRRSCQEKVGLYDTSLEGAEDWDMWLRIRENFDYIYLTDTPYAYRVHQDSMTGKIRTVINESSHKTFANAVARHGGTLQVERLYDGLNGDPQRIQIACLDLASLLLGSPNFDATYAIQSANVLNRALDLGNPPILFYILRSYYYVRTGNWEEGLQTLISLEQSCGEVVVAYIKELKEICVSRDLNLLGRYKVPVLNADQIRLVKRR